jgi:hypothetical protein
MVQLIKNPDFHILLQSSESPKDDSMLYIIIDISFACRVYSLPAVPG